MKIKRIFAGVLIASLFAVQLQALADTGLITHWKFDELSPGSTAVDSSISDFDGTPHGVLNGANDTALLPQPSTDVPPVSFSNPRSLFFQGDGGSSTGSYIDVSNWNVDTSDGFTVSLWAKPTTSSGSSWQRFFDFGNGPASDNIVFAQNANTDEVFFEVYNGGSTTKIIAPPGSWKVGSWQYYAATIEADGNATIYIDGNPVATGLTNKPINMARSNKYIGKSNWGDNYYQGYMDDLRVYSRALSQSEIIDLTSGNPGPGVFDNDGVTDGIENAAPNGGDANNDSVADSQQSNVASFVNSQTGAYVSVEAPNSCALSSLSSTASSSNAVTDKDYNYPTGFIHYTADCGVPGYTAIINVYVYDLTETALVLRKYDSVDRTYNTVADAVINSTSLGGKVVTKVAYQVTDGGTLDEDGAANGVIVDPVGLAKRSPVMVSATSPAPTVLADAGTETLLNTAIAGLLLISAVVAFRFRLQQPYNKR